MDPKQVTSDADGVLRCEQCGFAYALDNPGIAAESGTGLQALKKAVSDVPEPYRHIRPSPGVWSVNAYTAHLADAADVILWRARRVDERDRPTLRNHDQDRAVEEGRGDEQPAGESLTRLETTVTAFQAYMEALPQDRAERIGIHETAGDVRLSDIAHDMPHELHHHAGDIRHVGETVQRQDAG